MRRITFWAILSILCLSCLQPAQAELTAYHGATLLTGTGQEISPGVLLVDGGKILAVGKADEVAVPDDAVRVDLTGRVVIPGLVDTHSHLGVYSRPAVRANGDGNESTGPIQTIVRALDSVNPFDPGIRMALAGGITTANIMPGSANVIGGQTLYVKLRGTTPERMWYGPDDAVGGLKMANGENPKRSYGSRKQAPGTRMKVAALQRAEFVKAQNYRRKWEDYRRKKDAGDMEASPPDRDLTLEPLVEVLEKRRTVHFHTHRADDILTVLRLREEFQFDLVIQHGTEAYKVIPEIAAAGVPVSMTIVDSPGGKAEVVNFIEECGAELTAQGVKVIVNTDDPITESRFLLRTAATAHRGGLSETDTLKAITLYAAEAMNLGHRVGSLEVGKDADFVVLTGRPFSVYTQVLKTYIDGNLEFDLERDRPYRFGGHAARHILDAKPNLDAVAPEPIRDDPGTGTLRPAGVDHQDYLVFAGRLYAGSRPPIDDGVVHVRAGRILYAGPRAGFVIPGDLPAVSAAAVSPGLIDAYSVVPLNGEYNIPADQDANEGSDTNQADVRVIDGFHPGEPLLHYLLSQGVTVIHACPGRDNVIAGQSGVFRTHGSAADAMVIRFPQAMVFNLGESPKSVYDGGPGTRMGTAAVIRKTLNEARNYQQARSKAEAKGEPSDRDLKKEQLAELLKGTVPALFTAHRADDLMTARRLAEEFGIQPVLAMATEGYLIREELAAAKLPVIVHPTMQRQGDLETYHSHLGNAALLAQSEVPIAICSGFESYVPKTRVVRHEAAMAMVHGLGHERALRAVTLGAAEILKIDADYGSLDPGKVADLVLYDGDPFEHQTRVTAVYINGRRVFDRSQAPRVPLAERLFFSVPEIPCCNWW